MKRLQRYLEIELDGITASETVAKLGETRFKLFVQCVMVHELGIQLDRTKGNSVRQEPQAEIRDYGWDLRIAELRSRISRARRVLLKQQRTYIALRIETLKPRLEGVASVKRERVDSPCAPGELAHAWGSHGYSDEATIIVDADELV